MNAKVNVIDDASSFISENMTAMDARVRYALCVVSTGALFLIPPAYVMSLLIVVSGYLFTSALTRWDPMYALFGLRTGKQHRFLADNMLKDGVIENSVGPHNGPASNDAQQADQPLRKAG